MIAVLSVIIILVLPMRFGILVWILVSVPLLVALVRSTSLIVVAVIGSRTVVWLRGSSPVVEACGFWVMDSSSSSCRLLVVLVRILFDHMAVVWLH